MVGAVGVVPDERTQLALAAELDVSKLQIREFGWRHWLPSGGGVGLSLAWDGADGLQLLDQAAGVATLDRRGFMMLGATAVVGLTQEWLQLEPVRITPAVVRSLIA